MKIVSRQKHYDVEQLRTLLEADPDLKDRMEKAAKKVGEELLRRMGDRVKVVQKPLDTGRNGRR